MKIRSSEGRRQEKAFEPPRGETRSVGTFPVVCLGGSAGSLQPYSELIQEIRPDAGLAVVIVTHRRKGDTQLPEILAKRTSMPVRVVTSGMRLEPNHVFVVPPNRNAAIRDGLFHLQPLSKLHGWPNVITFFLKSLAREWKGKAVAAILSGLDSDGVDALRAIKAAGGITFAQKVETAEHASMPREAVKSGCVDFELTPGEIGRELNRIASEENASHSSASEDLETSAQPEHSVNTFPVVGIGASAGGLEAFSMLLEHLTPSTGMAFVLVQHLDPVHESQLTEILSRKTPMPISEVRGDTPVEPNHVYVMPPGNNLKLQQGMLRMVPRPETGVRNMPIDLFLHSLAADRQNLAIGVILSGTASDGTLGVSSVKAEGGITFAQDPTSAKFDGMPRSAIASGTIDFVLTPQGIANQLRELSSHSYVQSPSGPRADMVKAEPVDLERVFTQLRTVTGIDFKYYKHNTILRRMKRRMAVHGIENVDAYVALLERNRKEADTLAQDFLVNVTSFFREPDVHDVLRNSVFPTLLENRAAEDPIRIWVPGCSSGEESYSLAMSLTELLEERHVNVPIQIFSTDLSDSVIEKARTGVYLESAVSAVSPERLERFFVKRDRVYQVSQSIRDLCVFAKHDVTRDPPFSRLDLISCCNLLIYLGPILQKKVLSLFHYALKPAGFLVLGSSESVGAFSDSFEIIDRKNKIFCRKPNSARPKFELSAANPALTSPPPRFAGETTGVAGIQKEAERMLLAEYAPASVIIDESLRVVQVRGNIDPYLQVPQGAPTALLTAMVRPGLLAGLKSAVAEARDRNDTVSEKGLRLKEDQAFRLVDLRVSPIRGLNGQERFFLVLFEDCAETDSPSEKVGSRKKHAGSVRDVDRLQQEVFRLQQELSGTRDYLQSIIETQEAAAEELRSANEEAQANNEELDTAKEELQASNEELNTVNEELRIRNAEQTSLNADLRKLLESINVPLVMVGKDLRIRWFTAAMEPVLNLLPNDQGRPITDLRATLIPDFAEMLVRALSGTQERSVEFQRPDGGWLSLRILPYRGPENRIDGAIATLIDINDLKRARDLAEAVVETVREPLVVLNSNLEVRRANEAFYTIFHLNRQDTEGRLFNEIGEGQWNIPRLRELLENILPKETSLRNFEVEQHTDHLGAKTMLLNAREIRQNDGERMILLAIDDITELRNTTDDLRKTNEDLKQFIFAATHDLKEPLRMIVAHTQLLATRYRGQLDAEAAKSIQYAVEGALRLEALIAGLREFWQLSESSKLRSATVETADVLRKVLLNLETSIVEAGAKVTCGPLPAVMGTESTLIQLFQNLIANALKYRGQQPPEIHVSAQRDFAEWVFSVRDNGIGVDPQYARQIFGVFKRLHPPNTYPGTGIGLAICQKIVDRYGGRIWVESQPNQGADFKFAIPA